jgi:hypothetical protein
MVSRPPLVVYPSTKKLTVLLIAQCIGIVFFALACIWVVSSPPSNTTNVASKGSTDFILIVCTIILVTVVAVVAAGTSYRLLVPTPAVTITDEGLIDGCSFIFCGVGLVRWQDMQVAYVTRYSNSPTAVRIKFRYLVIGLRNERKFFAQQSPAIQRLHRLFTFLMLSHFLLIPQYMLSWTVDGVLGSLQTRYEAQRAKDTHLQHQPEPSFA